MQILFSIIIPVFQCLPVFRLCIDSILSTLQYPTEIILVNDNSPAEVHNYIEKIKLTHGKNYFCRVIHNEIPIGSVKSINRGLLLTTGKIIVFVDSDVILKKNWQKQMLSSFSDTNVGAVGGILLYPQTGGIQSCGITFSSYTGRHLFLNNNLSTIQLHYPKYFQTNAIIFAFCGFRNNLFKQIGVLDERFFNGYEDYDFMFRIKKQGLSIVTNTNIVGMHFEKSNGMHRQINRKQNLGLFWNLHAGEQTYDLWDFMSAEARFFQISRYSFIGIDLCQVRIDSEEAWKRLQLWTNLLRILNFSSMSDENNISLLEILNPDMIMEPSPFLFLCNNFVQLMGNDYWLQLRCNFCKNDIICDLCGNFILFKDLKESFWPGNKIR